MALTDNLQAFYKLSDLSDSSGNNRTLTTHGNVSFASGKIGNAVTVDSTGCMSGDPFNAPNDFSISFWGSAAYDEDNGALFVCQYPGLYIATRNDGSVSFGDMSSWESNSSAGVVTGNTWYHYCLVRNGGTANLYINNVLSTSSSENLPDLTNDGRVFGFFNDSENNHAWGSGSIDAVGIWNRALSDAEVAELYNNGTGIELDGVPQPTLVKLQAPVKFFGKVKFGV